MRWPRLIATPPGEGEERGNCCNLNQLAAKGSSPTGPGFRKVVGNDGFCVGGECHPGLEGEGGRRCPHAVVPPFEVSLPTREGVRPLMALMGEGSEPWSLADGARLASIPDGAVRRQD